MTTVWKFSMPVLRVRDVISFDIPSGAVVLSVLNQPDHVVKPGGVEMEEFLCVYAEVNPKAKPKRRSFRIAGTGHPLDLPIDSRFVGTVMFQGGALVFHVWELP